VVYPSRQTDFILKNEYYISIIKCCMSICIGVYVDILESLRFFSFKKITNLRRDN